MTEATGLMRYLMKRGVRVILFCKVRLSLSKAHFAYQQCDMYPRYGRLASWYVKVLCAFIYIHLIALLQAMKTIRADLSAEGRLDVLDRVMSYRGGARDKWYLILPR